MWHKHTCSPKASKLTAVDRCIRGWISCKGILLKTLLLHVNVSQNKVSINVMDWQLQFCHCHAPEFSHDWDGPKSSQVPT